MRTLLTAFVITICLQTSALSQTLCRAGEVNYFSCKVSKSGKIISVCGHVDDLNIDSGGWLQYRFGSHRAIELIFPEEIEGSVAKFEANYFQRYGVSDLRFISGNALYSVSFSQPFEGEDPAESTAESGAVTVSIGKRNILLRCAEGSIGGDTRRFIELSSLLRSPEDGKDLLSKYYKTNPK